MPRTEVVLGHLLSFCVELDGCIETTELLVLLSHTKLGHDHDSDKVVQLILEGIGLRVRALRTLDSLLLDLFPQAVTALLGESKSLASVLEGIFVSVQEGIAIGQV